MILDLLNGFTLTDSMIVGISMIAFGALFILLGIISYGSEILRGRHTLTLITGVLLVGLIGVIGWWFEIPPLVLVISVILWFGIGLYVLGTLLWLAFKALGFIRYSKSEPVYDLSDIQVRIMTIDAEQVVQETVNALPDGIHDRHVIAEEPIEVEGATVHVVPSEFTCVATRKGRALEWARQKVACDREHVLYLDEDTIVTEFEGLPDADIVQFSEHPYRTGSLVTYLAEIFRIGFQLEQRMFGFLPVPLYAWGGGIAIRKELEDAVTWNYDTLIEDTVFTWQAVLEHDASYLAIDTHFYNQAPPTIKSMIRQRRRWVGGSENELWRLPWYYRLVFRFRNVVWAMTPIAAVLPFLTLLLPGFVLFEQSYLTATLILIITPLMWSILGYSYFKEKQLIGGTAVLLTPLITVAHSFGALIGLVWPPRDFSTTTKMGSAISTDGGRGSDNGVTNQGATVISKGIVSRTVSQMTRRFGMGYKSLKETLDEGWSRVHSRLTTTPASNDDSLPFEREHSQLPPGTIVGLIVVLGTALRLYGLAGASLWVDEIYSIAYRGSLPILELITAPEPHPPLYFAMLKYWMALFGQSAFATRFLSVLFGVFAIVAMYYLGKQLFDRRAGYVAAVLLALSPFHIHASQTVRMYEPLTFFAILSLYFFVKMVENHNGGSKYWYVISTTLMCLTHLFGVFIILAQNIYFAGVFLTDTTGHRWADLKRWLLVQSAVGVIFSHFLVILLPRLLAATGGGQSNVAWLEAPQLIDIWHVMLAIAGAPLQYPIINFGPSIKRMAMILLLVGTVAVLAGLLQFNTRNLRTWNVNRQWGRQKVLAGLILVVCLLVPFVLSYLLTPMFVFRYAAPATVGFILLIASGIATIRNAPLQVVLMLALVLSSVALVGAYHETSTEENWEDATEYVLSDLSRGDLVILHPFWIDSSVEYYGIPSEVTVEYSSQSSDFTSEDAADLSERQQRHDTIWIIQREPDSVEPMLNQLNETHRRVETRRFGSIVVYKYAR